MIKKIVCLFCALSLICCFWAQNDKPLFSGYSDKFELYLNDASSTASRVLVTAGEYPFYGNVKGESCFIRGNAVSAEDVLKRYGASVVFTETVDGSVSYYAFSSGIKYRKVVDGRIINLHICVSDDYVAVGSPIIFGSF